jgi:hypothetical protein
MDKENKPILYKDNEGKVSVNTRFADENVWLTQAQLATIYQTTQVCRNIDHYNLDVPLPPFVSFSERWLGFNPSWLVSDPPIAHWHIREDNRQIMSVIQQLNPGAPTY